MHLLVSATDHEDAARIATAAGRLLLDVRGRLASTDGRALGAEGDRRSHELILAELATSHPRDAVLSEEGQLDPARLESSRVWVVDPLDGTREFGEGRTDWAVHVALVVDGLPVAGAVALPAEGVTLSTSDPRPRRSAPGATPRIVVSRTRPPDCAVRLADALDGVLVRLGSAGAKAAAVCRGAADVYVHAGGQYEWDSAAPVAVAEAAGLHASRLDGSPLRYNGDPPYLPDLLICHPDLAERALDALATAERTA